MTLSQLIDYFIHRDYFDKPVLLRKTRLFVRASLLTSLFSTTYIWLSVYFEYDKGVYLMAFNVIGFLIVPFLSRTKIPIILLANVYVFIGAFAVIVLTYYSGGLWSAIYPWIISIPVLALLVANRLSGITWAIICFVVMELFGIAAINEVALPVEYNTELRTLWFVSILPGLLLIIMVVTLVFEATQQRALLDLESKNALLESQKETIAFQSGKLEKLLDEKDYIIRILAHDLKNPLATISLVTDLLAKETDKTQQADFISMIDQASTNAQNLVKRVLEMDGLEQRKLPIIMEQIELNKVVNHVVLSLVESAKRKYIRIVVSADKPIHVFSDVTYLYQVLENLLSNAIKFSEFEKKIEIKLSEQDTTARIQIKDEGPGVASEEIPKLFVKFSRLSARPTGGESSSGLGLSLVKHYVKKIHGKVWYDEASEGGATFVVEIPMIKPE